MTRTGILLMAYGAPQHLDQVEAYYTHIRTDLRGRVVSRAEGPDG